jgi:hypothetical protein
MRTVQTRDRRRLRILLGGEEPVRSAPSLSLGEALRGQGIEVVYSHGVESLSTKSWISAVRNCDAIIWVGYHGPGLYVVKQLALAVACGCPVIRWWVGSDVLHCLLDPGSRARARILASFSAKNIAVAPHLVEELSSIGIRATMIPMVIDPGFRSTISPGSSCGKGILVYLPGARAAFYGEAIVEQVIRANPDLTFVIVGDDKHRFLGVGNVESLGWVSDMQPVYERVGCLLRVTEHDGLPRMVIEALLLGKYVIYSNRLPGTWSAKTYEEVQEGIDRFRGSTFLNTEGMAAARALLTPLPDVEFVHKIRDTIAESKWSKRICACLRAIDLTVRCRIRKDETRLFHAG